MFVFFGDFQVGGSETPSTSVLSVGADADKVFSWLFNPVSKRVVTNFNSKHVCNLDVKINYIEN